MVDLVAFRSDAGRVSEEASGPTRDVAVAGARGGFRTGRPVPAGTAKRHARFYDGVSRPTIRKVLRPLGIVATLPNGNCAVGASETCEDVWWAFDDRRVPINSKQDFDDRRRVRGILGMQEVDERDWVLQRYIDLFGREAIVSRRVIPIFGQANFQRTLRRLKIMAGIPVPPEDPDGADGWGERGGFRAKRPIPPGVPRHEARFYDVVSQPSFKRLRDWDVIGFEHGFTTVGPEDTCLEVWNAYDVPERPIEGLADFEIRRRIRVILKLSAYPQSDRALRRYLKLFGADAVKEARVTSVFGRHCSKDAFARLKVMAGIDKKASVPAMSATPEDVIGILPEGTRQRIRDHLARKRHPPIPPIDPALASRVMRLPDGPIRLMAAMALIDATANRRVRASRSDLVKQAERWSDLLEGIIPGDARASRRAMRAYFDGVGTRASPLTRLIACNDWFRMMNNSIGCARLTLGADAHLVTDLLPALRAPGETFRKILKEAEAMLLNKKPAERAPTVAGVIANLMTIQAAVENRVYQLEAILGKCMEALPKAAALLDRGLHAGFEWHGPVIRADGTLGAGRQVVSFSFKRESQLLTEAHECDPEDANLRSRLPRRSDDVTRFNGLSHKPETWDKIHVVYEGTVGAEGVEAVEPFFVDFFRWGVFETERLMSGLVRDNRLRLVGRMGLPQRYYPPPGFVSHGQSARAVALYGRGRDPLDPGANIIIPFVPLYHAMAYARIMLRYGIRWGARLGEILQLHVGCSRKHRVKGIWKPYLELKPKGWQIMGKFGIDVGTATAIIQIRAFTCARWYGWRPDAAGRPGLPVVPYGDSRRDDLPAAAYIFQAQGKALNPKALTMFARILLHGVVDLKSHDGRYVFATALGLDGTGYEQLGVLLHHSPRSAMPERYDLSTLIRSEEAAERFNRSVDAGVLGAVADG